MQQPQLCIDIRIYDEQPGIASFSEKDMAAFNGGEHARVSGQTLRERMRIGEVKSIRRRIVQLFAGTVKDGIFTEAFLKNTAGGRKIPGVRWLESRKPGRKVFGICIEALPFGFDEHAQDRGLHAGQVPEREGSRK